MMEFNRELEIRERSLTSHKTKPKKTEKKVDPTMLEALLTQYLSLNAADSGPTPMIKCAFCDGSHYADQC